MSQNIKDLITQFLYTDSISQKESLEEQIVKICRDYINKVVAAHKRAELNGPSWLDGDYSDRGGCLSINEDWITEEKIALRYKDSWSYGGSCDFSIYIMVEDILSFDEQACAAALKTQKINDLKAKIKNHEYSIRELEKKIGVIEKS